MKSNNFSTTIFSFLSILVGILFFTTHSTEAQWARAGIRGGFGGRGYGGGWNRGGWNGGGWNNGYGNYGMGGRGYSRVGLGLGFGK
uniref:Uncharacterized protein n=1 Tax=Strongyloides stercoralis TaxID=6248 RepID=A0A0K0E9A5_STRER